MAPNTISISPAGSSQNHSVDKTKAKGSPRWGLWLIVFIASFLATLQLAGRLDLDERISLNLVQALLSHDQLAGVVDSDSGRDSNVQTGEVEAAGASPVYSGQRELTEVKHITIYCSLFLFF